MEGNDATTTRDLVTSLGARRTSRKRFLAEAAGLTGALVAAGLAHPETANAAGTVRGVIGGTFFLELSTGGGGFVQSVAGGNITADVVDEQPASSFVPKHLGMPKFEEFVVKAGSGMSAITSHKFRRTRRQPFMANSQLCTGEVTPKPARTSRQAPYRGTWVGPTCYRSVLA